MKQALLLVFARPWSCCSLLLVSPTALTANRGLDAFAISFLKADGTARGQHQMTSFRHNERILHGQKITNRKQYSFKTTSLLLAKPLKAGSVVDNYQTVSVNCNKCKERLFRYKKKNGTKSNLVKCYIERICEDSAGILALAASSSSSSSSSNDKKDKEKGNPNAGRSGKRNKKNDEEIASTATATTFVPTALDPEYSWECPKCHTKFARSSLIHGRPALKMVGGKIRMTKK